jgi:hypothetical protein
MKNKYGMGNLLLLTLSKKYLSKTKKKLFETELNILAELQNSITEPRKNQDGS